MSYRWNHEIPDEYFYDLYNAPYSPSMNRHDSSLSNGSSRGTGSYYNSSHPARPYHETSTYQYHGQLQPTGTQHAHHPNSYHHQHSPSSPNHGQSQRPALAIHPTSSSSSSQSPSSLSPDPRQRFYCETATCHDRHGHRSSFSRRADLNRHCQSVHGTVLHACPWPRCERRGDRGFPRIDHLIEHRRGYHHEDIPKREFAGGHQRQ